MRFDHPAPSHMRTSLVRVKMLGRPKWSAVIEIASPQRSAG